MRKTPLLLALAAAVGVPAVAQAEPSETGECHQRAHDAFVAASSEGTMGDFMSDVIFGNEPNIEGPFAPGGPSEQPPGERDGRVVPSQSPGPFVNRGPNEPPRNDRTFGFTGGDLQEAVRASCP
jgi:hypothetical protein